MADEKDLIPPCVVIPEGVRIRQELIPGRRKARRSNTYVRVNTPKSHPSASTVEPDVDFSHIRRVDNCIRLQFPKNHPGFKEGYVYRAACVVCREKNISVKRVGNHMEITSVKLCCGRDRFSVSKAQ